MHNPPMMLITVKRAVLRFHIVVAPRVSMCVAIALAFSVMRLLTVAAISAIATNPVRPNTTSGKRQFRSMPIRCPPSSGPTMAPTPKEKLMAPTAVARKRAK
jgi:hypothetical protein